MDITGIAKSHQADIQKAGKLFPKKEWKLSDSLRDKITEYSPGQSGNTPPSEALPDRYSGR